MLHYAVERYARSTRCGLSYDQLVTLQHGFVYDDRDRWKIDCPNCKGFAFPARAKRRLSVLRIICGRIAEGFPSVSKWCPLSCTFPPPPKPREPFSPLVVLETLERSRQLVEETRALHEKFLRDRLFWQSERALRARLPAGGLELDLFLQSGSHAGAQGRRTG